MAEFKFKNQNNKLQVHEESALQYLTFPMLDSLGFVKHLFTTRYGGVSEGMFSSLNLSYTRGDRKECVDENYRRVAQAMDSDVNDIVCSDQTHTINIRVVTAADRGKGVTKQRDYTDVDGLVTDEPGIVLACFFADCVPIYLVDPAHHAIGLCHSGWRGTLHQISANALRVMKEQYGTLPQDVYACVGPSICGNCYEIGWDVASEFAQLPFADQILSRKEDEGKYLLDLWRANELVLQQAGVCAEKIVVSNLCTCCNPEGLFSHRASHGKRGNLGAFLKIV